MSQALERYMGFIVSALLFLLLAAVFVIFYPKVFFVMHPAELTLSVYGGGRLFPFALIEMVDVRGVPRLPNSYVIRSPLISGSGSFEAERSDTIEVLQYSTGHVADDIAALHPGPVVLLSPSDIASGVVKDAVIENYDRAYSSHEREAMLKRLKGLGAEAVVVPFPEEAQVLFDDQSLIFYLPVSFKPCYSGPNIQYFEPDVEALAAALVKGEPLRIETRTVGGSL